MPTTEQAGIPLDSAVAQQAHHTEHATERAPQSQPPLIAAIAAVKPDMDLTALRAIGKAIGCIARPYPIDDSDPRGTKRRIAVAVAVAAGAASALVIAVRRIR